MLTDCLSVYNCIKEARVLTPLQEHQQTALNRALRHNMVLAHSTGSGKTLTAIAAADRIGKPTTILTPASLVENFKKEINKHIKGGPPIDVISLPTATARNYQVPKGNTLIIDEAHSLRNAGTARTEYVREQAAKAGRTLMLTGTPAYNNVENWAPLVNILSQENIIPESSGLFRDAFVDEQKTPVSLFERLRGIRPGVVATMKSDKLAKRLAPYVDVFNTNVEKPDRIEEYIQVAMDDDQLDTYKAVEGSIPSPLRYKLRHNLPPSKAEAASLNSFYTGVRQVANTPQPFSMAAKRTGAKIRTAVDNLLKEYEKDKKGFRALVYSNFLEAGVLPYAKLLDDAEIPYAIFDGSLTPKQKKAIVDGYNNGSIPVILGTGSASEGLDLKGTTLIQVLEPHFNNSRIEQVIGRGIRYKSHSHLPQEKRKVKVQRYLSTVPSKTSFMDWLFRRTPKQSTSIDQYLKSRSEEKDALSSQIEQSLLDALRKRMKTRYSKGNY